MIESYGNAYNLKVPIVGRLCTHDDPSLLGFPRISFGMGHHCPATPSEYCAFITDSNQEEWGISENALPIPGIFSIESHDQFLHGDGVVLLPEGKVLLVYRPKSISNALFVNTCCNSKCIMCPQPPREKEEYDLTDLAYKILNVMDPEIEVIGITGGEPTLLGEELFCLVETIKKKFPLAALQILTNGRYFSHTERAHLFSLIKHPNILMGIPLFSDNPYDHDAITRAPESFGQTVKGIINLARFGTPIEIRIVMIKQVVPRLSGLVEFIYRNFPFVSQVCFMGVEPIGYARDNIEEIWIDPMEYQDALKETVRFLSLRGIQTSIYNEQLCVLDKDLWKYSRKSISDWKNTFKEECSGCAVSGKCGGFFESSLEGLHSRGIHKLSYDNE
jgi:His-Xaa-Ser system radical SAM maturase HxsC